MGHPQKYLVFILTSNVFDTSQYAKSGMDSAVIGAEAKWIF